MAPPQQERAKREATERAKSQLLAVAGAVRRPSGLSKRGGHGFHFFFMFYLFYFILFCVLFFFFFLQCAHEVCDRRYNTVRLSVQLYLLCYGRKLWQLFCFEL